MAAFGELGLEPVMGPELEFYLLQPSPASPAGWARYVENPTHVYTVGDHADPRGILDRMLLALLDAELGVIGAAHEYGMSQWEINLTHSNALDAADRAFRFKAAVKDLATRDGMLATFMGKPFNGDAGSGFHLHLSLCGEDGANSFADTAGDEGCAELLRHFIAGVIAHAPGLLAFLNPTVNSYRRIAPHELVPTRACWATTTAGLVRVPPERKRRAGYGWPTVGQCGPMAAPAVRRAGWRPKRELTPPAAVRDSSGCPRHRGERFALADAALDAGGRRHAARCDSRRSSDVPHHQALRAERYHRHILTGLAEYAHHPRQDAPGRATTRRR
jgi:hypothetical protein